MHNHYCNIHALHVAKVLPMHCYYIPTIKSHMHQGRNCEYYMTLHLPILPRALFELLCFCYVFTLSWCSSMTYGAATGPRASCVLLQHDCATRCALVSWLVKVTPRQSVCRNLNNVLICLSSILVQQKLRVLA